MSEIGTLTIYLWLVINGRDSKKTLFVQHNCTYDEGKGRAREFLLANKEMLKMNHLCVIWQANAQSVYIPEVMDAPQITVVKKLASRAIEEQ